MLSTLLTLASVVITILLGIVAYFLKGVLDELHRVTEAVVQVSERLAVQEEKGRAGHQILSKDIDSCRERINRIEQKVFE